MKKPMYRPKKWFGRRNYKSAREMPPGSEKVGGKIQINRQFVEKKVLNTLQKSMT